MNITLLAPHQDDEIISSFGLLYNLSKDHNINVIFATNGDFHGKVIALRRYAESIKALRLCNIPMQNVYYMGYGDTGMSKELSFLYNLYQKDRNELFPTAFSQYTYHPADGKTVHSLFFGAEAKYTKHNFITDLSCILSALNPDLIILPSSYDYHGDHAGVALFFNQYVMPYCSSTTYYYLIHTKDDLCWPDRNISTWSKPINMPSNCWEKRKRFSYSTEIKEIKRRAILCFHSQHPYAQDSFLLSFAKNEEIFFDC